MTLPFENDTSAIVRKLANRGEIQKYTKKQSANWCFRNHGRAGRSAA